MSVIVDFERADSLDVTAQDSAVTQTVPVPGLDNLLLSGIVEVQAVVEDGDACGPGLGIHSKVGGNADAPQWKPNNLHQNRSMFHKQA